MRYRSSWLIAPATRWSRCAATSQARTPWRTRAARLTRRAASASRRRLMPRNSPTMIQSCASKCWTLPNVIAIDGGLPIKVGNDIIGGAGASGSPGVDEPCVQAGLDKVADQRSRSIYLKLVPNRQSGELHVNLEAGTGDIQLWLPTGSKEKTRQPLASYQIHSDFPLVAHAQRGGFRGLPPSNVDPGIKVPPGMTFAAPPSSFQTTETGQRNGGGNPIHLRTTVGKVEIKLFN